MSRFFCVVAGCLLFWACGSGPAETKSSAPPDWVSTTPVDTDEYMFFVGSASDSGGDLAKAEENATYSLLSEIMRFIGVKITTETTSTAKASLDDFQAAVTATVKQTSSNKVAGFKVVDTWVQKRPPAVTVYILGQYLREDIMKEKARLEALFREQEEAISGPEKEGKDLENAGKYYDAIVKYIEAAGAASSSELENASIKFERNINNAKAVLSKLALFALSDNIEGLVGSPFKKTFDLKVAAGNTPDARGIPGVDVLVSYKEARGNRVAVKTVTLKTDGRGMISFDHPVPGFVGKEKLTMSLDFSSALKPIQNVPRKYQDLVGGLEDLINQKRVVFQYSVLSNARNVPTGVVVLDVDKAGNPTGTRDTASGILESLTAAKFRIQTLSVDAAFLRGKSDADIVTAIAESFGKQIERVVFGIVGIEEFEEKDGFLVKVSGTVKVADLKTGEILSSVKQFKRTRASSSTGAISGAFRGLGVEIGTKLASELP